MARAGVLLDRRTELGAWLLVKRRRPIFLSRM
jgi:hypothetical protein